MKKVKDIKNFFTKNDVLFILIVFIIFVITIINNSYNETTSLFNNIVDDIGILESNVYTITINEWIDKNLKSIKLYSKIIENNSKEKFLKEYNKLIQFDDLIFINKEGFYNHLNDKEFHLLNNKDYIRGFKGETFITEPLKIDGDFSYIFITPIRRNNSITELLGGVIKIQKFNKLMEEFKLNYKGSYSYIVNENGLIMYHPNTTYIMKENITKLSKLVNKEVLKASSDILNKNYGKIKYKVNNKNTYAYFREIENTDKWKLVTRIPVDYVTIPVKNKLRKNIIIGLLCIIIITLIILHISKAIRTRRNRYERELKIKEDLLEESKESEKLKTEFLSNISHELKTPLNMIFSSVQLLNIYIKDNAKVEKHLKIIKQNSYRLLKLINNLIDYSRIQSGYIVLNLENKDIVKIVEDITMSTVDYVKNKKRTITFDTNVEELIMAIDCDKIERIILNIISNAVKFTKEGDSIYVNILYNESFLMISIKDTGVGIPEEKIDEIFDRFKQVEPILNRSHEGSGLGLSLVKLLVEMHEGKISVESELNEGTEFIIELPVKLVDEKDCEKSDRSYKQSNIEKIDIEFSDIYS